MDLDRLSGPFEGLESRQVPIQDDGYRFWIWMSYAVFLVAALPLWWHMTRIPMAPLPDSQISSIPIKIQEFKNEPWRINLNVQLIDLHLESESGAKAEAKLINSRGYTVENVHFSIDSLESIQKDFKTAAELQNYARSLKYDSFTMLIVERELSASIVYDGGNVIIVPTDEEFRIFERIHRELVVGKVLSNCENTLLPTLSQLKLKFWLLVDDEISKQTVTWDLVDSINDYLSPFLNALSPAITFQIDLQIRLFVQEEISPENALRVLPSMAEETGPVPIRHFIINLRRSEAETKPFVIPAWGVAVFLHTASLEEVHVSTAAAMATFLPALCEFLGVSSATLGSLSNLETDFLLNHHFRHQYAQMTSDLLIKLQKTLKTQPGLQLLPEVAQAKIYFAISALHSALEPHEAGSSLDLLRQAYLSAYRAFYDPTLLGPPYFPDDHKFAIYLPVFLPLSLPILIGGLSLLREYRARNQMRSKAKTE